MKDRIKQIRKEFGINQTDFAEKLSVTRSAICKIESGENYPSEQTIKIICKEFAVNEDWLRTGKGEMKKSLTRNEEILVFCENLMTEVDDSFRKRFIQALSKLNERDWEAVEKVVNELLKN